MADSDKLVKNHLPVAALSRLGELGLEPDKYGSCSEKTNHNIGCTFWKTCPFGRAHGAMAPFKGTRPHNIGYYLKPLAGPAKTDWISCFGFCAGLYYRMRHALAEQAEGHKAEVIRIIAKEGEEIPYKIVRSRDANCNKSLDTRLVVENVKVKVPVFPDPLEADPGLAYEMEINKRFPVDVDALDVGMVADAEEVAKLVAEVSGPDIPMPDEVASEPIAAGVAAKEKRRG